MTMLCYAMLCYGVLRHYYHHISHLPAPSPLSPARASPTTPHHVPDHTTPRAVVQYTQPQHRTPQHISAISHCTQQTQHETPQQSIHNTQRSQKNLKSCLPHCHCTINNRMLHIRESMLTHKPHSSFPHSLIHRAHRTNSSS